MPKVIVWLSILTIVVAGTAAAASGIAPARVAARITTGRAPCSENGGLGYLWVSNFRDATIARVDPATNRVTGRIKVGPQPCGVAIGADALWVDGYGNGDVERVDPVAMKVVARIPVGPSLWDVEFGAGSAWATSEFNGTVVRIDPATNAITATIKVGLAPRQVRYGAGAIWVGNHAGKSIYRVDPATNRARAVPVGLQSPDSIAVGDTAIWVTSSAGDVAVRLDPGTLKVVARVKVGLGPVQRRVRRRRERLRPEQRQWNRQPDRTGAEHGRRDLQGRPEAVPGRGGFRRRLGAGRRRDTGGALPRRLIGHHPAVPVELRPSTDLSRGDLAGLFTAAYEGYFVPFAVDEATFGYMVDVFDLDLERSLVAVDGGVPVGLANLGRRGTRTWLGGVGVVQPRRREGIGELLTLGLLDQARAAGATEMLLEVIVENAAAIALYEKLGFVRTRELEVLSLGPEETDGTVAEEAPLDVVRTLIKSRREEPEPWQRDEDTVDRLVDRDPPMQGLIAGDAAAIYRPGGQGVSLVQAAGGETGLKAIVATLRAIGPVSAVNYPAGGDVGKVLHAAGAQVPIRQYEMVLAF